MIYPGRHEDQMRTANTPWFKLDLHDSLWSDDCLNILMGGSAIDAPEFIASGSTALNKNLIPYAVLLREVRREN